MCSDLTNLVKLFNFTNKKTVNKAVKELNCNQPWFKDLETNLQLYFYHGPLGMRGRDQQMAIHFLLLLQSSIGPIRA